MFMFYHQQVNLIPIHPHEILEVPFFWNAKHRGRDHLRHRAGDFSRPLWHAQLSHGRGQHMWKQGAKPHRTTGRWADGDEGHHGGPMESSRFSWDIHMFVVT